MRDLFIGLMSGTSADGIDAALVDFSESPPVVIETHYAAYPQTLREKILALCEKGDDEIQRLGELDIMLGKMFASTANHLLKKQSLSANAIKAIGSHGQTIRHHPHQPYRFTVQIGDPNTIAVETGITTIADFRRKDMALDGQGAPLVPAFHQYLFASHDKNRIIVNIGGMANVTLLPHTYQGPIVGFDTGPGNVLMDAWIHLHKKEHHDQRGAWGSQGKRHSPLLTNMLADPYFRLPPPKSTGREYFNLAWLTKHLQNVDSISPVDIQATLVELTAHSIVQACSQSISQGEMLICGGGVHNTFLMTRLHALAKPNFTVDSTQKYGIDPDWMEAIAFAWLARQTLLGKPGNLPSVTGARQQAILGGIYYGA